MVRKRVVPNQHHKLGACSSIFCIDNYYRYVVKNQIVTNKYIQKAEESKNDAGFHKVTIIATVHVAS